MLFKTLDHFFTIEAAEGRMVQGKHQRPISQKPRPGPIPPGKLFISAGCRLTHLQSQELGWRDFHIPSIFFLSFNKISIYLLSARQCVRCWKRILNRIKQGPWQFGVYILVGVIDNS